jgi:hypothetical protein
MPASEAVDDAGSEPRTRTDLMLEGIALRHQIAVLKRGRTRRPCLRRWDRLFWILLSWWWPAWRENLLIVQPETVLRWRRNGWSAFWRYRSRGRWRGGRPKVSREVRGLIARMARENFLWRAPRIHGELLMLGFTVSQATVSRCLPAVDRRPGQSWRTFIRIQTSAFSQHQTPEEERSDAGYLSGWNQGRFMRSLAQIARLGVPHGRWHARRTLMPPARRIAFHHRQSLPGALRRVRLDTAPGRSWNVCDHYPATAVTTRSPPHHARASPRLWSRVSVCRYSLWTKY